MTKLIHHARVPNNNVSLTSPQEWLNIRTEVYHWIWARTVHQGYGINWKIKRDGDWIIFKFDDPAVALQFKLTWG